MDNFDRRVRYAAQRFGLSREEGSGMHPAPSSAAQELVMVYSALGVADTRLTPAQRRRIAKHSHGTRTAR